MAGGPDLRLAHVEDHEAMRVGFATIVANAGDMKLIASVAAVDDVLPFLAQVDLVVLDLRLPERGTVRANVERLTDGGARVLCYTGAEDPAPVREAVMAGALGVIRKSEPTSVLLGAIRAAARGETLVTVDWAAALDGDPAIADARLSPQEQQVLALYASGEKTYTVGQRLGVSEKTISEYVRRIRTKYAIAGRPAYSRVDLYKRAIEDGYLADRDPEDTEA